jgi:hypothetical protein
MEDKKPDKKVVIKVVKELPMQPVTTYEDEDTNTIYHLITIEDYLSQLANARPK